MLPVTLAALVPAVVDGLVREVIIADGGSDDETRAISDSTGAAFLVAEPGRGMQLRAGAEAARHDWLLFLHSDTVLEAGWHDEAAKLIGEINAGQRPDAAAVFRFTLDDRGLWPRLVERGVAWRCRALALPYGDQGLLISRRLYDQIGGYNAMPLFEDVDIVRRIGRRRLLVLRARATTSSERFQAGYAGRVIRNWKCMLLYFCGTSPERLAKIYNG
jgi:rSAM/selenodomain-associated transferase 2